MLNRTSAKIAGIAIMGVVVILFLAGVSLWRDAHLEKGAAVDVREFAGRNLEVVPRGFLLLEFGGQAGNGGEKWIIFRAKEPPVLKGGTPTGVPAGETTAFFHEKTRRPAYRPEQGGAYQCIRMEREDAGLWLLSGDGVYYLLEKGRVPAGP